MICPYCGKEMQKGYIEAPLRHPLVWQSCKRPEKFPFHSNDITLARVVKGGTVDAYHCESCRKFLIDENDIQA